MPNGPVLIPLDENEPIPRVADAAVIGNESAQNTGAAMAQIAQSAARPRSKLTKIVVGLFVTVFTAFLSAAALQTISNWISAVPWLGWVMAALCTALILSLLLLALREARALMRLARIDKLRHDAAVALEEENLDAARGVADGLVKLYQEREELKWARENFDELRRDQMDAAGLLAVAQSELLAPLDRSAEEAVHIAARQVATVTALVPLALADVASTLAANLRMIRRIAEIYGGRGGIIGSWRLTRVVLTHLVATGAIAVGDDMLEPLLGGTVLAKISRRFGEGLVNGTLTARVGIAAIEVCRPLNFEEDQGPKTRKLVKQALSGLFDRSHS